MKHNSMAEVCTRSWLKVVQALVWAQVVPSSQGWKSCVGRCLSSKSVVSHELLRRAEASDEALCVLLRAMRLPQPALAPWELPVASLAAWSSVWMCGWVPAHSLQGPGELRVRAFCCLSTAVRNSCGSISSVGVTTVWPSPPFPFWTCTESDPDAP